MIVIVDYGVGNLSSVKNGFAKAGFDTVISGDRSEVARARGLVLPGVGAFGKAMENLKKSGLTGILLERVAAGIPLLGICVGMQMLFDCSREMGRHRGLGLIKGEVVRFDDSLKVPQVGWNRLALKQKHPLLAGIRDGDYVYFVHSYHARPEFPDNILAVSWYGREFPAVVQKDNIFGIQFHPEKSSRPGLRILSNFGGLAAC